jgi:hypothetical protein
MSSFSFASRKVALALLAPGFLLASLPDVATAAPPACYSAYGGYCQYDGKVRIAYINAYNQIILYFDAAMPQTAPGSAGISGVSIFDSAVYPISENPDFAKALYASLLAAQARGALIQVQMMGTSNGYMKMDRIWVHQD